MHSNIVTFIIIYYTKGSSFSLLGDHLKQTNKSKLDIVYEWPTQPRRRTTATLVVRRFYTNDRNRYRETLWEILVNYVPSTLDKLPVPRTAFCLRSRVVELNRISRKQAHPRDTKNRLMQPI